MNEWDIAFRTLQKNKLSIIIGCVVGFILGLFIILFQKPVYQAEMIIAPTERTGVPSLASFLPKAAADAPALQYFVERIDASQSTDFNVFETLITSPSIIHQIDKNLIDQKDHILWFQKNLRVRPVGLTQFRKITLKSTNKEKLIPLLNTLYRLTDQSIRQDKKMKTARRISYLTQQLKKTLNTDHRDAIIALLKEQEQTQMMVSIDNAFAADIIEPAYIKPKPVAPNAMIIFPAFIIIGGFFGLIISNLKK